MRSRIKRGIVVCCVSVAVCVILAITEHKIRMSARVPISVTMAENVKAEVEACAYPDLLWVVTAWFVKIKSDTPVAVDFDGKWQAELSPGNHILCHDHDWNNTSKYGGTRWWQPPKLISVKNRSSN